MPAIDADLSRVLPGILWAMEWGGALLAVVGALVMSMNRPWSWHAWSIWLLSNLLLLVPTTHSAHWGLAAMQMVFLVLNVNGLLRCRRTRPRPARSTLIGGGSGDGQ